MNRARVTEIFNLGFRRSANDRASAGIPLSATRTTPNQIPSAPSDYGLAPEPQAWKEGYSMGYETGASDAELASVSEPGAHGMLAGLGEGMLELFGVFDRLSDAK
jgi:hypothetical protein